VRINDAIRFSGAQQHVRPDAEVRQMRPGRRRVLELGIAAAAAWVVPWPRALAAERSREPTAPEIEGPFYPPELAADPSLFVFDDDNDLIWRAGAASFARGTVLELTGRVLDTSGGALPNLELHVWQCDAGGRYHHAGDTNPVTLDPGFQGFGRTVTDGDGRYAFRTIAPVPYPGRTPHIHFKVRRAGKELLTTQCYVKGEARNMRDGIYRSIRDPKARDAITVDFAPIKDSRIGELAARFDIVLGVTPEA